MARKRSHLLDYMQLLRLPNVFTAMADVTMGFFFVHGDELSFGWELLGLLVASSSFLYLGGMVLNDVVDCNLDAIERPERPIPSGRISLKTASRLSTLFLVLGTIFGSMVAIRLAAFLPLGTVVLLEFCIERYNRFFKPTPLGPMAMGCCRFLNVLLGMSVLAGSLTTEHWVVAGGVGLYITGVTWFARTEAVRSNRWPLGLATLTMVFGIGMIASVPQWTDRIFPPLLVQLSHWHILMAAVTATIGWRCVVAIVQPEPINVQKAVSHAVLSLILLDAAACFVVRGPYYAVPILLLVLPALLLRRSISPT